MNKKYRLLKDLPEIKAGEIFLFVEQHDTYECKRSGGKYIHLPRSYVENNPEWFEKVKEQEWEIVAYKCKFLGKNNVIFNRGDGGIFWASVGGELYPYSDERFKHESEACEIHSVKRISDGITFSI